MDDRNPLPREHGVAEAGGRRRSLAQARAGQRSPPDRPTKLGRRSWWEVLKRTAREFREDNLTDWAAALTYFGVLSIFPGLLVLVSALGLFGQSAIDTVIDNVSQIAPGPVQDILTDGARSLEDTRSAAGILVVAGLLGALWSASGYVGAFMRASNAIYDVPEGRPIWKKLPIRLAVTIVVGVLLVISALMVVLTGRFAERVGDLIGLGSTFVTVWDIAKWPVLVISVSLMFAILYWAAPNARQGGFRWVSPGGLVAVLLWIAASAGFAFYVANFGSYNRVYGTLAGVIIFFVWLWVSNIAVLLGAELDAELQRGRAIAAGHPAGQEPFLDLRDTRKIDLGKDTDLG